MSYAKVKVNELLSNTSQTILDLTQVSTSSTAINSGIIAHAASGELVTGAVSSDHSVENAILNNDFSGAYENSNITSIFFGVSPALTSISLPNVTALYDYAFQGCTSLASINIPNITSIPNYCFSNCTSLSTLFLDNVTTFNDHSFSSTSSLTIVTPDITNYGTYTFQYSAGDYIIDVGTALTNFNSKAFYGTDNMTSCILILRNPSQVVVAGSLDGMPKPFWVAAKSAILYAPSSLLASYQSASNWSQAYATESTTFMAIESSYYETHYADGTLIS